MTLYKFNITKAEDLNFDFLYVVAYNIQDALKKVTREISLKGENWEIESIHLMSEFNNNILK